MILDLIQEVDMDINKILADNKVWFDHGHKCFMVHHHFTAGGGDSIRDSWDSSQQIAVSLGNFGGDIDRWAQRVINAGDDVDAVLKRIIASSTADAARMVRV
jgi:hypothetical protein